MVEMFFCGERLFFWTGILQCDWKMHLQHVQMHEFGIFLLQMEFGILWK